MQLLFLLNNVSEDVWRVKEWKSKTETVRCLETVRRFCELVLSRFRD